MKVAGVNDYNFSSSVRGSRPQSVRSVQTGGEEDEESQENNTADCTYTRDFQNEDYLSENDDRYDSDDRDM